MFCIAFIGAILFTFNNENFYNKPIGQIIDVKHVSSTPTKDAQNNRDIKYKNQLKVKILNGQFAGEKRRRLIISTSNRKQILRHFAHTKKYYYIFLTSRVMLIL